MNFAPTWDLFILVFFAIIVAYSFIIGRAATIKIVIATYIAILAADGVGNLLGKVLLGETQVRSLLTVSSPSSLIIIKILIFVFAIVLLTVRGAFFVETGRDSSWLMGLLLTSAFGFLSAGLIVATILVYVSGGGFLTGGSVAGGLGIAQSSYLARLLIENYNAWFALPAIAFAVNSLVAEETGGGGGGGEAHGE